MNNTQRTMTLDMSFPTVLFLIFLVLKLCDIIDWSWWLVFAPLWIPCGLILAICIAIFIVAFIQDSSVRFGRKE